MVVCKVTYRVTTALGRRMCHIVLLMRKKQDCEAVPPSLPTVSTRMSVSEAVLQTGLDTPINVNLIDWGLPDFWRPLALRVTMHATGALVEHYLFERHTGVYYDKQRQIWRANWRESATSERKTRNFSATPSMCAARMEAILFKERQHAQFRLHNLSARGTDVARRLYDCELVRYDMLQATAKSRAAKMSRNSENNAMISRPPPLCNTPETQSSPVNSPEYFCDSRSNKYGPEYSSPLSGADVSHRDDLLPLPIQSCSFETESTEPPTPKCEASPCNTTEKPSLTTEPEHTEMELQASSLNFRPLPPLLCADEYPSQRNYDDSISGGNSSVMTLTSSLEEPTPHYGKRLCGEYYNRRQLWSDRYRKPLKSLKRVTVRKVGQRPGPYVTSSGPPSSLHEGPPESPPSTEDAETILSVFTANPWWTTCLSITASSRDPDTERLITRRKYNLRMSLFEAEQAVLQGKQSRTIACEDVIQKLLTVQELENNESKPDQSNATEVQSLPDADSRQD